MWDIFLAVGLGVFLGWRGWIREKGLKWNVRLQTVWLMLLIFCMGVSIGRNGEIVKNLPQLGGKALLFAVLAAAGSVAVVYVLSSLFLEKEGKE